MKHVKLFENFDGYKQPSSSTLAPLDISREGESILVMGIGDDTSIVLLPTKEAKNFVKEVESIIGGLDNLDMSTNPGNAYVFFDADQLYNKSDITFQNASFESETPNIDFWIFGNQDDLHSNENAPGNGSWVSILKRGSVITASAGSQPSSSEVSINQFLDDLRSTDYF